MPIYLHMCKLAVPEKTRKEGREFRFEEVEGLVICQKISVQIYMCTRTVFQTFHCAKSLHALNYITQETISHYITLMLHMNDTWLSILAEL